MKREEILRRLVERLARGEISEKTYLEIKARYESEPEEVETPPHEEVNRTAEAFGASLERTIRESIEPVLRNLPEVERTVQESVGAALRAVDFSGLGRAVQSTEAAVKIAGSGVVSGNPVRTRVFKSAGSGRVVGDLEAGEAKVAGSCEFEGNVTADEFHTAGSTKVSGSLHAKELHASGSLSVGGDVEAREAHLRGSTRVGGALRADEFHLAGSAAIGGGLVAKEVKIDLGGHVSIPTIEASEIDVRRPGGFFRGRCELTSDRIEAREIYLECTSANFVRGREVSIGPHCRIELVEARELTVHESSEVRERRAPSAAPAPPIPPSPPTPPAAPSAP